VHVVAEADNGMLIAGLSIGAPSPSTYRAAVAYLDRATMGIVKTVIVSDWGPDVMAAMEVEHGKKVRRSCG
jgi:hypothetical protein